MTPKESKTVSQKTLTAKANPWLAKSPLSHHSRHMKKSILLALLTALALPPVSKPHRDLMLKTKEIHFSAKPVKMWPT